MILCQEHDMTGTDLSVPWLEHLSPDVKTVGLVFYTCSHIQLQITP